MGDPQYYIILTLQLDQFLGGRSELVKLLQKVVPSLQERSAQTTRMAIELLEQ